MESFSRKGSRWTLYQSNCHACGFALLWEINVLCFTAIHQSFTAFETSTAFCWDLSHQPRVSYLRLPQTSVSGTSLFPADSQIINASPFWRIRANFLSIFSIHCMHLFQFHSLSTALKWDQKTKVWKESQHSKCLQDWELHVCPGANGVFKASI